MERQAFLASLELTNLGPVPIEDIRVDIEARNVYSQGIVGAFAVTPTVPTLIGTLAGEGDTLSQTWTLIPGELGITNPEGEIYNLRAQIVYTYNGVVFTTTTQPVPVTVLPQPRLRLSFSHSQPDSSGNFYLEVGVENQGYGLARNLKLDLSGVTVLSDLDENGRSLIFDLISTTINGQPQPVAYIFNFGDLEPDEVKTGRWDISVRASDGLPLLNPRITDFQVGCRHLPYQGLELSSLIVNCGPINQFFLTSDCPFCSIGQLNLMVGGPINTGNGNYSYRQSTPAIPTVGEPLQLEWTYNSLSSGAFPDLPASSSRLGTGWTHNYDLELDFSQPDRVVFKAAHGSPFIFERVKESFRPAPGVWGTLTRTAVITGQYVYTLTAVNQTTYVFSDTGQLLRQFDPQGNVTEMSYDGQGRLSEVREPVSDRYLTLTYDAEGRLSEVSDPINRTTSFGYTIAATSPETVSLLAVITDTRNEIWDYDYTQLAGGEYILSKVTDPDERLVEQTEFDDWGRAISQTFRGEYVGIVYHEDGRRTISDGLGRVMTHTYNSQYLLVGQTDALGEGQVYTLDSNYNRTFSTDKNGNPTHYERTPFGLTTAITDALTHTTRFEYDARNNLTRSIDARGKITTYLYDAQNNLISTTNHLGDSTLYTYNGQGQQTSVTDENDHTTRYGYDAIGQRTVITDALGYPTTFQYDAVGRVVTTTDALGKVTVNQYDGADNLVQVTENYLAGQGPNYQNEYNLVTTYTYDGAGRRETSTDTLGRVSRNLYDDEGRLWKTIQNEHPSISDPNHLNQYNLVTEYVYDEAGNQVAVIDPLGRETQTEYDELNRVKRTIVNYQDGVYDPGQPDEDIITRFAYDDNGNLVSTFDVLDRETRTEYDKLNRVKRTIVNYENGQYNPAEPDEDLITAYEYDEVGNQVKITDPLGRETLYSYDDLNRVETITNPKNGVTEYDYDPAGNRASVTDAESRTTLYDYDALNRVVTTTNALSGTTVVAYDPVGNRASVTDARGKTTTFDYDSLYRLKETTDAANQTTAMSYDALGNRLSLTDAEGRTTLYAYDSLNRVVTTTNALSGTIGVSYDAAGNRRSVTDANNHTSQYDYDDLDRLVETTDPNNLTSTISYDGLGNRRSVTNAANETVEFEYDRVNRLVLSRDPLGNELSYRYNGAGSRVALIDAEGVETRYEYDELDRLAAVIENYEDGVFNSNIPDEDVRTEYDYDAVGNRTGMIDARSKETTYTYDDLNRRIEMADPLNHVTRYGYDPVGNRTVITDANLAVTLLTYDDVNRLAEIDYSDSTPDVSFTYDKLGNRKTMLDGTGTTTYTYDALYRLTGLTDGAELSVGYGYDPAGNRTHLNYPTGQVVTYTYDTGNRLETVTDWRNGQYGYDYDNANRLAGLSLPNGVDSSYNYDEAGRLSLLAHQTLTETLASYSYGLDRVGNRRSLTETVEAILNVPGGAYLESEGLVVIEAEHFSERQNGPAHQWLLKTNQSGYTGTSYLQPLPDTDRLYPTGEITASPRVDYPVNFTTPGTYTVWVRGNVTNAAGDSIYVGLGAEPVAVSGFAPGGWSWQNVNLQGGGVATLPVASSGLYTLNLWMREDGVRIDRLLLTTDTNYLPEGFGLAETARLTGTNGLEWQVDRTIEYAYDNLYRLTGASYTTGEVYQYSYDPVGNRLQQIIDGDTTAYLYDDANRLEAVVHQAVTQTYTFDDNGNLLNTGVMTNSFDTANRLVSSSRDGTTVEPVYNGVGDRVGQTIRVTTTHFALDVQGLPEVIYTDEGELYLHLPGVIVTEKGGEVRYLLSDGLGSIRQATDEAGTVVAYHEFDPYGNPVQNTGGGEPYGYTGEWWESYTELLFLRARWYAAGSGTFLSRDPWEGNISRPDSLQGYIYASDNPIVYRDASGLDYIPWLDRYTCDDPRAGGGYVHQYDQATGTWGLWPCIVDPNNVTRPSTPPVPPSPQPIPPSVPPAAPPASVNPDCDPEKPCRVILGANKLAAVSEIVARHFTNLRGAVPYHSYLLVVDPNQKQREGFESPETFAFDVPGYINVSEQVTVYYFGAFSERALKFPAPDPSLITIFNGIIGVDESYFGKLVARYGIYNPGAPDFIDPKKPHLAARWEFMSRDSKCDDILKCFKRTFDLIDALEFAYGAGVINSNRAVSTALRNCGLPATHPAQNVWAPGWYNPD